MGNCSSCVKKASEEETNVSTTPERATVSSTDLQTKQHPVLPVASTSMAELPTKQHPVKSLVASTSMADLQTKPVGPPVASTSMADLQTRQNAMESPGASTSIAETSSATGTSSPKSQEVPPTLDGLKSSFGALKDKADNVDDLISLIRQVLEEKKSKQQDKSNKHKASTTTKWSDWVKSTNGSDWVESGAKFLEFARGHFENMGKESGFNRKAVGAILDQVGHLHWAVGGLSIVACLLANYENISANKEKCQKLLERMVDLAYHVKKIYDLIPKSDEKLKMVTTLIVEGFIKCSCYMHSTKFSLFFRASIEKEDLNKLEKEMDDMLRDLTLVTTEEVLEATIALKKQQSVVLLEPKPFYPKDAVGIKEPEMEVINKLNLNSEDESPPQAVVLYGVGGIGKTTLATAVVANLKLENYSYARAEMDEQPTKNDLIKMQQKILIDAFPNYKSGQKLHLRDCKEGQHHLREAFKCQGNKPVFLFIDNVLRKKDMKDLLPEDLEGLPKRSRMLLTTRNLTVAEVCKERGLNLIFHKMDILPDDQAIKILCEDAAKRELMKDNVEKILQICSGIPLVLKIVGAYLRKMEYKVENCTNILNSLEKGDNIQEDDLSERLTDSVYSQLEKFAQEAFLDICCFFNKWDQRQVEDVVGADALRSLIDAALVNTSVRTDREGILMGEEGEEWLTVHDVIRAKGRSMSNGTRIMDLKQWLDATEDQTKMKAIKGVWLEDGQHVLEGKHLNLTKDSIRILALGDRMSINGEMPTKFKELKYLQIGSTNKDS